MADKSDLAGHLAAVQVRCFAAGAARASEGDFVSLLAEVEALALYIACARQDLNDLEAADIVGRHVPAATDELDAVVAHTAAATETILDVCERLEADVAALSIHSIVTEATSRIYEACSFQDITGQRVAKVVQTLQIVEARVQAILRVFGQVSCREEHARDKPSFLSGPQRPMDAMDQIAVDTLLANLE